MKQRAKQVIQRNPLCGLLLTDLRKQGMEVQTWGVGPANELVYAGVHYVQEISGRSMYRLHNHWQRWRKWYDSLPENRERDYPAKHNPQVAWTGMRLVDAGPSTCRWLRLTS